MSVQYVCDRCKKIVPGGQLTPWALRLTGGDPMEPDLRGDACETCLAAIQAFLSGTWQCPRPHPRGSLNDPSHLQELLERSRRRFPDDRGLV